MRETICKDRKRGIVSVSSGRDGRVLWIGTTNKSLRYHKPGEGKFSTPWSSAGKTEKWKAAKLSYLATIAANNGLCKEAEKPLIRLATQFWKLGTKDFKGLFHSLVTMLNTNTKVRRPTAPSGLQSKPFLTGGGKILNKKLGKVPLWDWRPI